MTTEEWKEKKKIGIVSLLARMTNLIKYADNANIQNLNSIEYRTMLRGVLARDSLTPQFVIVVFAFAFSVWDFFLFWNHKRCISYSTRNNNNKMCTLSHRMNEILYLIVIIFASVHMNKMGCIQNKSSADDGGDKRRTTKEYTLLIFFNSLAIVVRDEREKIAYRMENKYSSHLLNKLQTYKINLKDKKTNCSMHSMHTPNPNNNMRKSTLIYTISGGRNESER